MVFSAADRNSNHFVIFSNARDIGPQLRLHLFRDRILAFLGTENQMDVISSIGMGHCAAPPGLYLTAIYAPTASAVGYDLSSLTGLSEMMCLYWDVISWP